MRAEKGLDTMNTDQLNKPKVRSASLQPALHVCLSKAGCNLALRLQLPRVLLLFSFMAAAFSAHAARIGELSESNLGEQAWRFFIAVVAPVAIASPSM